MKWTNKKDAWYATGYTWYRVIEYCERWFLVDSWNYDYRAWQLLGRAGSMEEAQMWVAVTDVYYLMEKPWPIQPRKRHQPPKFN